MKKSELKELLKVITEEVMRIKEEATYTEPTIPPEHRKLWDDYTHNLITHDWEPEYSDDPGAAWRAQQEKTRIFAMQKELEKAGLGDEAKKVYDFAKGGNIRKLRDLHPHFSQKAKLTENKGLSGFKKATDTTEHTENVADSKSLTPTSEPKEKEEGKKLPVVKKPATPSVGLKEEILQMIREEIEEYRTKGALGANNPKRTTAVKKYTKKGLNPNMGRPPKNEPEENTGEAVDASTRDAIERILSTDVNASDNDILNQLKADSEAGQARNLDPKFIKDKSDEIKKILASEKPLDQEEAPEDELQQIAQAEKSSGDKKAIQRASWIKKLKAAKLRANKPLGR